MNVYCQMIMKPSLGFEGVALSIVCMQWANMITIIVLIVVRKWWIRKYGTDSTSQSAAKSPNGNAKYEIVSSQEDDANLENDQLASHSDANGDIESKLPVNKSSRGTAGTEDPEDNFPPITFDVFHGWFQFLKLGIPGAASLFIGT
jgi:hypothetical protein